MLTRVGREVASLDPNRDAEGALRNIAAVLSKPPVTCIGLGATSKIGTGQITIYNFVSSGDILYGTPPITTLLTIPQP